MKKVHIITISLITLLLISCGNVEQQNIYDTSRLQKVSEELKQIKDIKYFNLGYDSEGNRIAWITPQELIGKVADQYQIPEPLYGYYFANIAKEVMDNIPSLYSVWIHDSDELSEKFLYLNRNTYENKGLKDLPKDPYQFYKTNKRLDELVDSYWFFEEGSEKNYQSINQSFSSLFGDNLENMDVSSKNSLTHVEATISLSDEAEVNKTIFQDNIAQSFVLSIGRYSNKYWDSVYSTSLIFKNKENKELFSIQMQKKDFSTWLKKGLEPSEVYNYSKINIYDSTYHNFFTVNDDNALPKKEIEQNLSVQQIMEKISVIPEIKVEFLSTDENNRKIIIRMNGDNPTDLYKKQMDISQLIMTMPIDEIWFVTEGKDVNNIIFIDRERYHLLMYRNDTSHYGFPPNEWPTMASRYWDIGKSIF